MLNFEKLDSNSEIHIDFLYFLLKNKKHNISHEKLPKLQDHRNFIKNHPYRLWMIVKYGKTFKGAFYLTKDNVIGISLNSVIVDEYCELISLILNRYKPLKPIPSIRSKYFTINANPKDKILNQSLRKLNMKFIQKTFAYIPDRK